MQKPNFGSELSKFLTIDPPLIPPQGLGGVTTHVVDPSSFPHNRKLADPKTWSCNSIPQQQSSSVAQSSQRSPSLKVILLFTVWSVAFSQLIKAMLQQIKRR